MTRLLVCAPLAIEARAIRRGLATAPRDVTVVRTGLRAGRLGIVSPLLGACEAVAVAGFGGALDRALRPGEVLVATEVRAGTRRLPCAGADLLAGELVRVGVRVRTGTLITTDHLVRNGERARLSRTGARAVDMEAGHLMMAAAGLPVAVVRAIVDTPDRPLLSPATFAGGVAARSALRRIGPALVRWSQAIAPAETPQIPSTQEGGSG